MMIPLSLPRLAALAAAAALPLGAAPALAQQPGPQSAHNHAKPAAAPAAAAELADGEVRNVNAAKGTNLLKHGEIRSLGMSPMTMGFKLKDPKVADGLKVGDKIRFTAVMEGETLVVTRIVKP
jgi:Cu/Ag efflux protein CusF